MKNKGLGEFEELVLLAVCILEKEAYGISVKREVEKHSGRSILLGAVHITLYRLQDKGWLRSEMGGNTDERGGTKKALFYHHGCRDAAVTDGSRCPPKDVATYTSIETGTVTRPHAKELAPHFSYLVYHALRSR